MLLLPLLVVSSSARFFVPQVLPRAPPSPPAQVQFMRSSQPTMIADPALSSASVLLPSTLIADDSTLVLVGGVGGLLFIVLIVGTVVTNFGIRKS
jgi:hypothetical protein